MKTTRMFLPLINCLFCSLFFLPSAFAQTGKGTLLLGGNAGMSFYSEQNENVFNASLSTRIGFFVVNRFAVGASLPLSLNTSRDYESWNIGIGPFARYYIGKGKVNPFMEVDLSWSRFRYRYREPGGSIITNTNQTRSLGLGIGLAYFITPNIGLETILSYDLTGTKMTPGRSYSSRGRLNLNVGFQVYFSRSPE